MRPIAETVGLNRILTQDNLKIKIQKIQYESIFS